MTTIETVTVTQEDREAAADWLRGEGYWHVDPEPFRRGEKDDTRLVQSFAHHRQTAIEAGLADGRREGVEAAWPTDAAFQLGATVQKKGRASWRGRIVGWYRTELTALGYAVESLFEPGSVQIYPESALIEFHWRTLLPGASNG